MSQVKQEVVARVYVENGPTIRLSSVEGDPIELVRRRQGVVGIDAKTGDRVAISSDRVVSIVEVKAAAIEPGIFWGRALSIRSASAMVADLERMALSDRPGSDEQLVFDETLGMERSQVVVLVAEDLASSVVVVYDLGTDAALWVNPASSSEAIELSIQGLRAMARAESVEDAFQQEGVQGVPDALRCGTAYSMRVRAVDGGPVAQARSAFESGDVQGALEWAHTGQVAEWLSQLDIGDTNDVQVVLGGKRTGWTGVIDGHDPDDEASFLVRLVEYAGEPNHNGIEHVQVRDIVSWALLPQ